MALNRIWKSCSADAQLARKEDFKLITEHIKKHCVVKGKVDRKNDDLKYLAPLSDRCKEFVLSNSPNLYHSFMAIINSHSFVDCNEMLQLYMNKYRNKRPYLSKNEELVEEVAQLCWKRYYCEGH